MVSLLKMKERPKGFLAERHLPHDSEPFDYIVELHDVLWRFVRAEFPGADGSLSQWIPAALAAAENRKKLATG